MKKSMSKPAPAKAYAATQTIAHKPSIIDRVAKIRAAESKLHDTADAVTTPMTMPGTNGSATSRTITGRGAPQIGQKAGRK